MEVLARVGARHDRDLGRLEIERVDPAGLDQGDDAERLDAAPKRDEAIRIAEPADEPAVDVDLDDVAAVDALLDPVANLADEDRRDDSRAGRGRASDRARCGRRGGWARAAGQERSGAVTITARIPRRAGIPANREAA